MGLQDFSSFTVSVQLASLNFPTVLLHEQFRPPYIGGGLVHERVLTDFPLLHGLLQNEKSDHGVNPPSTAKEIVRMNLRLF